MKMNKYRMHNAVYVFVITAAAVAALAGCSEQEKYDYPDFKIEREAEFELLTGELESISVPSDMYLSGDYIVIIGYDRVNQTFVHIYDREKGSLVADGIRMGRGPKEIMIPVLNSMNYNEESVVIYDSGAGRISVPVESFVSAGLAAVGQEPYEIPSFISCLMDAGDLRVVIRAVPSGKDIPDMTRIEIQTEDGAVLYRYNEFPDIGDISLCRSIYSFTTGTVSPDGKKMALAPSSWGGILEFFSLEDGIENRKTEYMFSPGVRSPDGMNIELTEDAASGFQDLYATDERLYGAVGNGVRFLSNNKLPLEDRLLTSPDVVIFDWKGRAVEKIETDYNVLCLCTDEEKGELYAVISDVYQRNYIGKLSI